MGDCRWVRGMYEVDVLRRRTVRVDLSEVEYMELTLSFVRLSS